MTTPHRTEIDMNRQDLIDIAYEAISNAHDMDTTLTDFARAAVDALMPFMKTVDEPIKYAQECAVIALKAKGYERGDVSMVVCSSYQEPWTASIWLGARGGDKHTYIGAKTFSDLVAAVDAKIADLPSIWTDEQVAQTLGIAA